MPTEMTFEIGDEVTTQFAVMMGTPVPMIVMSKPMLVVRVLDPMTSEVSFMEVDDLIRVED